MEAREAMLQSAFEEQHSELLHQHKSLEVCQMRLLQMLASHSTHVDRTEHQAGRQIHFPRYVSGWAPTLLCICVCAQQVNAELVENWTSIRNRQQELKGMISTA